MTCFPSSSYTRADFVLPCSRIKTGVLDKQSSTKQVKLIKILVANHRRTQGGSWGARKPPFCKTLFSKQPTTGG